MINATPEATANIIQTELLTRLLGVTEFLNEVNVEKYQGISLLISLSIKPKIALQPQCCRQTDGDCPHEQQAKQNLHRSQIRESLWKAHLEAEEQKKMAQLDENENEDFKNRINPPGVYQAHRDSEGLRKCKSRTLIYNKRKYKKS